MTFACIPLLLLTLPAGSAVPDPGRLVAGHLQAIGGRDAASAVVSLVRKGNYTMAHGEASFAAELYATTPGKWQFLMTIPGTMLMEHATNGKRGWVRWPEESAAMPEEVLAQEDCAFNLAAILRPDEYLSALTVKGRESVRGREVWVVQARLPGGRQTTARFDTRTGLLVGLAEVEFEDYRQTGRVRIPHTIRLLDGKSEEIFAVVEARENAPAEGFRFDEQESAPAYREALRRMTRDALDESLPEIDGGAARSVLEELHSFSPSDGRILYDLILAKGYTRGLEIGTAEGNSAIWMALAFRRNGGKLITIEKDPKRAKAARANFQKAGLDGVVECRNADAFLEIPELAGSFDFVFMDTGTALHKKFLDLLYARVPRGGTVSSHNANSFARQMPDFLAAITRDPNLDTRILHTATGGFSFSARK